MKLSRKSKVFRGLTQTLAALTALCIGVTAIASEWASKVNDVLGTQSYQFVTSEDGSTDTTYFKSDYSTAEELVEAREALIRQTVAEGAVLLKNENDSLPLETGSKVTLLGISSVHSCFSATSGGASFDESLATKLSTACESVGLEINPVMNDFYEELGAEQSEVGVNAWTGEAQYAFTWQNRADSLAEIPVDMYPAEAEESYAEYNDAAIVVIARMTGEGSDFSMEPLSTENGGDGEHNILQLSADERAVIEEAKANFDNVIVFVNTDNMVEIEELKNDPQISAILWCGAVGNVGMYGIADILCGNVSPSGRLADTITVSNTNNPAAINTGTFTFDSTQLEGDTYTHYVVYAEGLYVGYKYYETRYEDMVLGQGNAASATGSTTGEAWDYEEEVTYGFGEGLSYTIFETTLDEVTMDVDSRTGVATVTVTNTGAVAGKYPVQIYAQSPYTEYDQTNLVEKSSVQLLGYGKTDTLEPGASQTVEVSLNLRYLASYDYTNAKTYILDAGTYYIATGNGAHEALNNILAAKGKTVADGMTADGDASQAKEWVVDALTTIPESETGYEVTNQLDDCDLNYWLPGTVTYLSRSDWDATFPQAYTDIVPSDEMVARLNTDSGTDVSYVQDTSITLEGLTTEADTGYTLMMLWDVRDDYDNEMWDLLLDQMSYEDYCYCIYTLYPSVSSIGMPSNNNTDGPNGLNAGFTTDSTNEYYIDAETASEELLAYRCNTYPSGTTRTATYSHEIASATGRMMGNDGLWTDKGGQTGPGGNLHRTAFGGRNNEYCSEDSVLTTLHCADEIATMTEMGLGSACKHMAFNDQETYRQGLACFFNEQAARENNLRAFEGAYVDGKPLYGMSSFSRFGLEPSSSYASFLTTILRDEWGWNGFVMTDMAHDYMPVVASVIAGTDQWCAFSNERYLPYLNEAELEANPELAWACREAAHRVMYMTLNSNAVNGLDSSMEVVSATPWWQQALYGVDIALGVLAAACLILYIRSGRKDKKTSSAQ
ncbi:MAG: glycoside hydrolase family 3 C-terminal domain-containing protein [Clostridiales bacterium]|nr:glycoside hydrolase family 3 C-terminal domain-containing protein [Clostridiales bacterium]